MRRLPHLNGIKAFECAARTGSFAAAAAELNVSAAAVSRMVGVLEGRLGISLFERSANRLTLTAQGRTYQVGLSPILDALAQLTEQLRAQSGNRVLTIGVGPTFAIRWLIPRLESFRKVAPDVEVRVTTGGVAAPFADDWTCGIRLGDGNWPGLVTERLFEANLIPVCAPRLAQRLRSPRQLKPELLLRVAHAREDWALWFRGAGLAGARAAGPVFAYYGQALQAATDGVGVSLGFRPYIDDDLKAGRLLAPFNVSVSTGNQWHLLFKASRGEDPAFLAFRGWIKKAVEASAA